MSVTKKRKKQRPRAEYMKAYRARKKAESSTLEKELDSAKRIGLKIDMLPGEIKGALVSMLEEAVKTAIAPLENAVAELRKSLDRYEGP